MARKVRARLELSEIQRAEVRQAFDLFDTDGQGEKKPCHYSDTAAGCVPCNIKGTSDTLKD